ncbi:MAG: hypothetical protein LAT67_14445 [Balneolales bacterium]|nr:hypothetical protein [Balneolales bacterium]
MSVQVLHKKEKELRGWKFAIARFVSNVLSPLTISVPLFGFLVWVDSQNPAVHFGMGLFAVYAGLLFFYLLLPVLVLVIFLKKGKIKTMEIRKRSNRINPFIFGLLCYIGGLFFTTWVSDGVGLLLISSLSLMVVAIITATITLFWKISIHCAGISIASVFVLEGWSQIIFHGAPELFVVLLALLIVGLVVWSRVQLRAHTFAQTLGGVLLGFILPLAILRIFSAIW